VLDDDLWKTFNKDPKVHAKRKLDEVSYVWDEIVEELHQTYLDSNFITNLPHISHKLTDLEKAMRVMARVSRTKKKVIGLGVEFSKKVEGSATSVCYLEITEWTAEWQEKMDYQQREFGYFVKPQAKGLSEHEYPDEDNELAPRNAQER